MMSHLQQAFEYDIRIRTENDGVSPEGVRLAVEEIGEGVVYDKGGVKITAFEVDHAPVKPALGIASTIPAGPIVLSGDTRVSQNLIRHAQNVDVLVHEVFAPATLQRAGVPAARAKSIVDYHTTPEQAGEVFARLKPKLAVYSHYLHAVSDGGGSGAGDTQDVHGPVGAWRGSDGDRRWRNRPRTEAAGSSR
jgi:ribonuclease Z